MKERRKKNSRIRNIVIARYRPDRIGRTGVLGENDSNITRQAAGMGQWQFAGGMMPEINSSRLAG